MQITIEWTQEKKDAVCQKIEEWINKRGAAATCGEGIMQDDNCLIYAPDLIASLVDEIIKPKCSWEEED